MLSKTISFLGHPAVLVALILILFALLWKQPWLEGGQTASKAKPLQQADQLQQKLLLRTPVLMQLKDPDSATFRNEVLRKERVLCGEYNSKNAMGGYVGYSRFIVVDGEFVDFERHGPIALSGSSEITKRKIADEINTIDLAKMISELKKKAGERDDLDTEPVRRKQYFDRRWSEYCV